MCSPMLLVQSFSFSDLISQVPPLVRAFEAVMRGRLGRQDFTTLSGQDSLRFSHPRSVQRVKAKRQKQGTIPKYYPGINARVQSKTSVERFGQHLVVSAGDATRGRQMLVRVGHFLVGQKYHPDCSTWETFVWFVPEFLDELIEIIEIVVELQLLSSEFFTEQYRCISAPRISSLSYVSYPEPSKGSSGFMTLKYWFTLIYNTPQELNFVAFITDGCAYGIGAGKALCTPSEELIKMGCTYLGLPLDDYKYYDVYCRPSYIDSNHVFHIPKPVGYLPDISHWVRLVRRNLDNLAYLVFWAVEENEIAGSKVASFANLRKLATLRLKNGMRLSDIVNVNKYADMKNDAAYSMVSSGTIELLREHYPEDVATLLVLEGAHYLAKVMREKTFTNPILAVEYAWRCAHVFELQTRYIKEVCTMKSPGDCLPSYQFIDGLELMACKITNHFLMFHRHCLGQDGFDWSHSSLAAANSDDLEGTHSQGRHQKNGHMDVNFTFAEWLNFLSSNESINQAAKLLEAGGVLLGKPKHTEATYQGRLKLGVLEDANITHLGYLAPEGYDEFVEDMIQARERGIEWARSKWESSFGLLAIQQFKDKAMWTERVLVPKVDAHLTCRRFRPPDEWKHLTKEDSMLVARDLRVRHQVLLPGGMRLASGSVELTQVPAERIHPDKLLVPEKVMKVMKEMDEKLHEQKVKEQAAKSKARAAVSKETVQQFENGSESSTDDEMHDDDENNIKNQHLTDTKKKSSLYAKLQIRLAKSKLFAESVSKTSNSGPRMLDAHGSGQLANVKQGVVLKDRLTGEYQYTDRALHRYQRPDYIARDRRHRNIVCRVRGFEVFLREGHDVILGSCLLVCWGATDQVAVVRILSMYNGDADSGNAPTNSMKLSSKNKKQSLRLELLKPTTTTSLGSQLYTASGYSIGPVGPKSVVKILHLQAMVYFVGADRRSQMHDALLGTEDIAKFGNYKLITAWDDVLKAVKIGLNGEALKPEQMAGWNRFRRCYKCKTSWEGGDTGVLVSCTKCKRSVHQECVSPIIVCEDIATWVCAECNGECDLCMVCGEGGPDFDFHATDDISSNDLLNCKECDRVVHQSCHEPALYPLPIGHFTCSECVKFPEDSEPCDSTEPMSEPLPQPSTKPTRKAPRRTSTDAPRRNNQRSSAPASGSLDYTVETHHSQPSWRQIHGSDAHSSRIERLTHTTCLAGPSRKRPSVQATAMPKPSFCLKAPWYKCVRCGEKKATNQVLVNPYTKDAKCSILCVGQLDIPRKRTRISKPNIPVMPKSVGQKTLATNARKSPVDKLPQWHTDWHQCVRCLRRMETSNVHIHGTTKDACCIDAMTCAAVNAGGRRPGGRHQRVVPILQPKSPLCTLPQCYVQIERCDFTRFLSRNSTLDAKSHAGMRMPKIQCSRQEDMDEDPYNRDKLDRLDSPQMCHIRVKSKLVISFDCFARMSEDLARIASRNSFTKQALMESYAISHSEPHIKVKSVIREMLKKNTLKMLDNDTVTSTASPCTGRDESAAVEPRGTDTCSPHSPMRQMPPLTDSPTPERISISASPSHQSPKKVLQHGDDKRIRQLFDYFVSGTTAPPEIIASAAVLRSQWKAKLLDSGMSLVQMSHDSMQRLGPESMLEDRAISAFTRIIMPHLYDPTRRVIVIDSLATKKVLDEGVTAEIGFYKVGVDDKSGLRSDTSDFAFHLDPERTHKIVFIVNYCVHWYIVCFDVSSRLYTTMNSCGQHGELHTSGKQIPTLLANWMQHQHAFARDKHNKLVTNPQRRVLQDWLMPQFLQNKATDNEYHLSHVNTPQQNDNTSCGVFVIAFVYFILQDLEKVISAKNPLFQTLCASEAAVDALKPFLVHVAEEFARHTSYILEPTQILDKHEEFKAEFARHAVAHARCGDGSHIPKAQEDCRQVLLVRLSAFGLQAVNTITNGDCMLDALAKTFNLGEITLDLLRASLISVLRSRQDFNVDDPSSAGSHSKLRDRPTVGVSHVQDPDWEAYITRMSKPGEWCDELMLMAASIHFSCSITVIGSGKVDLPSHIYPPPHWNVTMNSDVVTLGHIQECHYIGTQFACGEQPSQLDSEHVDSVDADSSDSSHSTAESDDSPDESDGILVEEVSTPKVVLLYGGRDEDENAFVDQVLYPVVCEKLGFDIVCLKSSVEDLPKHIRHSNAVFLLWRDFSFARAVKQASSANDSIRGRTKNVLAFEDLLRLRANVGIPSISNCIHFASKEPYMRALVSANVPVLTTFFLKSTTRKCGSTYSLSCLHGNFTDKCIAKGTVYIECRNYASNGKFVVKRPFSSQSLNIVVADDQQQMLHGIDLGLANRAMVIIQPWSPLNEVSFFISGRKVHYAVLTLHKTNWTNDLHNVWFLCENLYMGICQMALDAAFVTECIDTDSVRVDIAVSDTLFQDSEISDPGTPQYVSSMSHLGMHLFYDQKNKQLFEGFAAAIGDELCRKLQKNT